MITKRNLIAYLCVTFVALSQAALAADYTVKAGDTLSSIAQEQLNDSARWTEIAELNSIEPPYQIAVGTRLTLPGQTASVEASPIPTEWRAETSKTAFFAQTAKDAWPVIKGFGAKGLVVIGCTVLVVSFVVGICLKISCRLFKVECSFFRTLAAGTGLVIAYIGWYGCLAAVLVFTFSVFFVPLTALLWFFGYLALSFLIIKRAVDCNWLESAGLFFVSGVVGTLLVYVVVLVTGLVGVSVLERAIMLCSQP